MKKIKTKRKTSARVSAGDFLLDIHTEPLPARFVNPALEQLEHGTREWLKGKINHGDVIVYGTLRHLVLLVKSVALKGHDRSESFKGPKESVWRASDGSFTPAAQGFARRYGLAPEELKPVDGVLYAQVETKGVAAGTLLAEMIVDIVTKLQFPKFMTWESSGFKFGRPIRAR
jgi:glycyl-tRNA synthetase beta chain